MTKLKILLEQVLKERITDEVYHVTATDRALSILGSDTFKASSIFGTYLDMKQLIREILKEKTINNVGLMTQILYHGTKYEFDKFDLNFFNSGSGDGGWLGYGIYLTNDYEYAESYGNVLECKINIKNPYIISEFSYSKSPEKLANELGVKNAREITKKLIKEGYDSVVLTYPDKGYTKDDEYSEFIEICVFNPNDIQIMNNLNKQVERHIR